MRYKINLFDFTTSRIIKIMSAYNYEFKVFLFLITLLIFKYYKGVQQ